MAKFDPDRTISQKEIAEYLDRYSDFDFELKIIRYLSENIDLAFIDHGGLYTDAATNRPRQFDIRFSAELGGRYTYNATVECKNIQESAPLVVHDVPIDQEAKPFTVGFAMLVDDHGLSPQTVLLKQRVTSAGKSIDRIGWNSKSTELISDDSDLYAKWAQALSSLESWMYAVFRQDRSQLHLFEPVLAIPDGSLWLVRYGANGSRARIEKAQSCYFYVGKSFRLRGQLKSSEVYVPHIRIVTHPWGLKEYCANVITLANQVGHVFDV